MTTTIRPRVAFTGWQWASRFIALPIATMLLVLGHRIVTELAASTATFMLEWALLLAPVAGIGVTAYEALRLAGHTPRIRMLATAGTTAAGMLASGLVATEVTSIATGLQSFAMTLAFIAGALLGIFDADRPRLDLLGREIRP